MQPEQQERLLHILGIIWRALFVTLILTATFVVLRYTVPLIYPFIFAWLIALMIEPLSRTPVAHSALGRDHDFLVVRSGGALRSNHTHYYTHRE